MNYNIDGFWTGEITGTNRGAFTFDVQQTGSRVEGIATISDQAVGVYQYRVAGEIGPGLTLKLHPIPNTPHLNLGIVSVDVLQLSGDILSGRWKSDIGTHGTFQMKRREEGCLERQSAEEKPVFVVHGHDEGAKHAIARFIERLGLSPVILQEQLNEGRTLHQKFSDFASTAGFAVVLMTPDDCGYRMGKEDERRARPRQNVVWELGYFSARLGRKTLVLTKGEIEMPSDLLGLVYEQMDTGDGWKLRLARELRGAGYDIDLNQAIE